jgi:transposase InsO family protein
LAERGRLFLAAILDLHSRFVVGWSLSAVNDRHLAVRARAEAKEKLFDYIEVFYNRQRRHSSLDYVSPAGYEKAARESRATA